MWMVAVQSSPHSVTIPKASGYSANSLGNLHPGQLSPGNLMHSLTNGRMYLPPHLELLNAKLLALAGGHIKRLLVTMPPRHGKSELCSHYLPAWYLGTWPDRHVILASYEADFAVSWGRKARDSFREATAQGIFPGLQIRPDVSAASRWEIAEHGGGMITAGAGGAITGRGGNLFVIDDPFKNAEEANSPAYREKMWGWYVSTAFTRLEPGGSMMLVMTRWNVDDLGGRVVEFAEDAEPWTVINIPAIAEENDVLGREAGAALWPERYPLSALADIRSTLGSYYWSALYQQSPIMREGALFQPGWFEIVDAVPAEATRWVRYWDRAASVDGDWTVGVLMCELRGVFYVVDVVRFRGTPGENEQRIRQVAEMDGQRTRQYMEQEPGSSGKDTIATYSRLLAGYSFRGDRVTGSKEARAEPFAAQAEAGNVKLVRAEWNRVYLEEMEQFPHGKHDDQVDGSSGAFGKLVSVPAQATMQLVEPVRI